MADWWEAAPLASEAPSEQWWSAAPLAEEQPKESTFSDVAKSTGAGLVRGVTGLVGLPGDAKAGFNWALDKLTGAEPKPAHKPFGFDITPTSQTATRAVEENVTGKLHEPQTTLGKYARTIGEFAPAALAGPGGIARRMATQAVLPAVGSEAAGQATEGTAWEPYARIGGALAFGLLPSLASRAISPLPIPPERRAMVDALRAEGVRPTAGQATGRRGLQYFESEAGGNATARILDQQADDFTRAALRRVGENAPRATPEVVDRAFTRIGQQFDDLAARNNLQMDPQLGQDLGTALREYSELVQASQQAPAVRNLVADVVTRAQQGGGAIPGATYQTYRSRLDRLARGARADPQLSEALFGIRNALDQGMERSMQAAGNAADVAAWQEARNQYRNMIVLEQTVTGAGEGAAMGAVSPARLRQATVGQNRRSYARGRGDFAELARSGEAILRPLPQSGTAPRAAARAIPAALVGSLAGPPGAAAAAAAAVAGPAVAGRIGMSRPVQGYLGNQLAAHGGNMTEAARRQALIQMLMAPRLFAPSE
jgi:hypothetical protein